MVIAPPRRRARLWLAAFVAVAVAYLAWPAGRVVTDGRHDRGRNALWLQHGWLGDDAWFARNHRDPSRFRSPEAVRRLAAQLRAHGVTDVFPHLCPVGDDGGPAAVDDAQVERFLDGTSGLRVMMYDTGIVIPKAYESLMARWTRDELDATPGRALLLGLPAHTDAGVGWHHPWVEDLAHALRGVHAGLPDVLPPQYQGVALYAEWELDDAEWQTLRAEFLRPRP